MLTHEHSWPEVNRGGERYLHELAGALTRADHDVLIVTSGSRRGRRRELGVPVRTVRRREVPLHRLRGNGASAAFSVAALGPALMHRPQVWHALGVRDAAVAATVAGCVRGMASAYTELGIPAARSKMTRPDAGSFLHVVRHVDHFSCLSERAATALRDDFGREAAVEPGGVRLDAFRPQQREQRPTVLFSGALAEPRKNVRALLAACAALRSRVPDLQVWLSGPGSPPPALAGIRDPDELVTKVGLDDRSVLAEMYARAWCVALPSEHEAQGLAVLEGLAAGTPAVVLRGEAPADLLVPGTGVVSDGLGDLPRALVEAIELASTAGTASACRERAAFFDWDASIVPRMLGSYERALG